jgi:hypothetical protein
MTLISNVFGKLTVIGIGVKRETSGHIYYSCKCECGKICNIRGPALRTGKTSKCLQCSNNELHDNNKTHGMFGTPTYHVWNSMKERCYNPDNCNYHRYGGRGISICKKWRESFSEFFKDMGVKPPNLSIERINNEKGYYKSNCKWATVKEQAANRRTTVYIEHDGERMILADWARRLNTGATSIKQMMGRGKSFQEAIDFYTAKTKIGTELP